MHGSDLRYLPGGGVNKNELYKDAIEREVKEELGIQLLYYHLFGVYQNRSEGKSDTIVVFKSDYKATGKIISPSSEIAKIDFFAFDNLPKNISPATKRRLSEYKKNKREIVTKR